MSCRSRAAFAFARNPMGDHNEKVPGRLCPLRPFRHPGSRRQRGGGPALRRRPDRQPGHPAGAGHRLRPGRLRGTRGPDRRPVRPVLALAARDRAGRAGLPAAADLGGPARGPRGLRHPGGALRGPLGPDPGARRGARPHDPAAGGRGGGRPGGVRRAGRGPVHDPRPAAPGRRAGTPASRASSPIRRPGRPSRSATTGCARWRSRPPGDAACATTSATCWPAWPSRRAGLPQRRPVGRAGRPGRGGGPSGCRAGPVPPPPDRRPGRGAGPAVDRRPRGRRRPPGHAAGAAARARRRRDRRPGGQRWPSSSTQR